MPYIKQVAREFLDITDGKPATAGELNYIISTACLEYIKEDGLSYKVINEVIGVLECAKLELYRRIASPYEDTKSDENGDIYD